MNSSPHASDFSDQGQSSERHQALFSRYLCAPVALTIFNNLGILSLLLSLIFQARSSGLENFFLLT
jgi:hypothetical protein